MREWESWDDGSRAEEKILRGIFHHMDILESLIQSPPKVNHLASTYPTPHPHVPTERTAQKQSRAGVLPLSLIRDFGLLLPNEPT